MSEITRTLLCLAAIGAACVLLMFAQTVWSDYWCGADAELVRLLPRKTCVLREVTR